MARLDVTGGAELLSEDLRKLGQITAEDVYTILTPAADELAEKLKAKIAEIFTQRTGKLAAAIQGVRKTGDGPHILVYPQGPHHKYHSRRSGGLKNATAAEVGFVLEYGSAKVRAMHWLEKTCTENEEAIGEKIQEGFDAFCDARGIS